MERLGYSPGQFAEALSISRPTVYKLLNRADFPRLKIGRRTVIPAEAAKRWMEEHLEGNTETGNERKHRRQRNGPLTGAF